MNHVVWCFTTQGMCTVGQEEIVTALEVSPDESTVPRDMFTHLYNVYEEAGKGIIFKTEISCSSELLSNKSLFGGQLKCRLLYHEHMVKVIYLPLQLTDKQ